jgi:hypothetical protein
MDGTGYECHGLVASGRRGTEGKHLGCLEGILDRASKSHDVFVRWILDTGSAREPAMLCLFLHSKRPNQFSQDQNMAPISKCWPLMWCNKVDITTGISVILHTACSAQTFIYTYVGSCISAKEESTLSPDYTEDTDIFNVQTHISRTWTKKHNSQQ